MENEKLKFKKLQEEHENERNFLLQTIENNLETHKKQLAQLNSEYEAKLKSAYEQRDKLVDEYEQTKNDYKRRLENILEENKIALSHIEKEYKEKYEELQKNHVRLVNDMKRDSEKFYIALEQCEQEYERELQKKKEEFEEYMNVLEKETEELKDTRDEYKREADKLEKKIVEFEKIEQKLEVEQEQLVVKSENQKEELTNINDQLNDKQKIIKDKEKSIKELKSYSEHLENFKFVLDHKIKTLKDEKEPMEKQVKILESHIKNMYNELAEESTKKKNLIQKLKECEDKYKSMREEMKKRVDEVTFAKRRLEMMQYDILNILRNIDPKDWGNQISEVISQYGGPNLDGKFPGLLKTTKGGKSEYKENDEESDDEVMKVKEELLRQRNWLNSKLKNMKHSNKKLESERKRIQSENLKLITECNLLREDNQKITNKVQMLEKKFKDILGISFSNTELIDSQIENFLKRASSITTKHKDTPYITLKKDSNKNNRNSILSGYYKQFTKPGAQMQNMTMGAPGAGRRNINSLIGDLALNQTALQNQNLELKILRDQVSSFMQQNTEPRMIRSGSQPSLSSHELNKLDDFNQDENPELEYQLSGKLSRGDTGKLPSLNASRSSKSRHEL